MARIRTIKPEFFVNEALSGLPIECHMLAAGLLCYADDEGYFNAHPGLIKAAVFPLRELSVSVPEILRRLHDIRYIGIGEGADGRQYGHIIKFADHQKVSHARDSKIKKISITWHEIGKLPEIFRNSPAALRPELNRTELKGIDIPTTSDADASDDLEIPTPEPSDPPSLKAAIFKHGLPWLSAKTGKAPDKLRAQFGKWCRDHGDTEVMAALVEAQRRDPVDPIAWLEGSLRARAKPKGQPPPRITPIGVGG